MTKMTEPETNLSRHFDGAQRAIGEIFVFENQRRDLSTSVEMTGLWVEMTSGWV